MYFASFNITSVFVYLPLSLPREFQSSSSRQNSVFPDKSITVPCLRMLAQTKEPYLFLTLLDAGFSMYCPLVSQLWGPKNSRTQIFQTDKVLSFDLELVGASPTEWRLITPRGVWHLIGLSHKMHPIHDGLCKVVII